MKDVPTSPAAYEGGELFYASRPSDERRIEARIWLLDDEDEPAVREEAPLRCHCDKGLDVVEGFGPAWERPAAMALPLRGDRRRQRAHALLHRFVAEFADVPAADLLFRSGAFGRIAPALRHAIGGQRLVGVDVSLAYSGSLFLAGATSGGRIGVDVEIIRPDPEGLALPRYAFSRAEHEWLSSLPEEERLTGFYRSWTAKEAILKAIGLGVHLDLDQVETGRDGDAAMRVTRVRGSHHLARGWRVFHRKLEVGGIRAMAAVAHGG